MDRNTPSDLNLLSVKRLHAHYLAAFGKPTASRNRTWLIRRLQAALAVAAPVAQPAQSESHPNATIRDPGLPPGTELRRTWKGKELVVSVTSAGFVLKGKKYRSLSAAAKQQGGES